MRALTVQPGTAETAQVEDLPDPAPSGEHLLVEGLTVGVCGTDREIVAGGDGWAPPGRDRLVLGHESLGRVRQAPPGSDFHDGDLVAGVVRRPALVLQARPTLSPGQLKTVLRQGTYLPQLVSTAQGTPELNVDAALTAAVKTPYEGVQSDGTGALEATRGSSHIIANNVTLTGQNSIFGPFDTVGWAAKAKTQTTWSGGVWMGYRMAADGWTGTSFTSKTWGSATWPGGSWGGTKDWTDPAWNGRTWNGRFWAAGTWTGRFWASDDWSTSYWG
jgi:hypothetical protein